MGRVYRHLPFGIGVERGIAVAQPLQMLEGTALAHPVGMIEGIEAAPVAGRRLATGPVAAVRTQRPMCPAKGQLIAARVMGILG